MFNLYCVGNTQPKSLCYRDIFLSTFKRPLSSVTINKIFYCTGCQFINMLLYVRKKTLTASENESAMLGLCQIYLNCVMFSYLLKSLHSEAPLFCESAVQVFVPSKDRGEVNAFQDKGHIEVKEEDENSNGNVFLNLKLCAQRRDREEQRETYNKRI